jgi:phage terminase small subunit
MIRARPEVAMIADADRRIMMWMSKFGLTPADRSRVSG